MHSANAHEQLWIYSMGKRFRVRGQGVSKDGHRGDLIVEVGIVVPERIGAEEQRLMQQFAKAAGLEY